MKKDLSYYLNLKYPIALTEEIDDEGKSYFVAEIPDLPGCGAHGRTIDEAYKNSEEAKELWIEVSLGKGLSIPEPVSEDEFSGKFLLRIPAKLHMKLALKAKKENLSLNQFIRRNLETIVTLDSIEKKIEEMSVKIDELSRKVSKATETEVSISSATGLQNVAGVAYWTPLRKNPQESEYIELSYQEEAYK